MYRVMIWTRKAIAELMRDVPFPFKSLEYACHSHGKGLEYDGDTSDAQKRGGKFRFPVLNSAGIIVSAMMAKRLLQAGQTGRPGGGAAGPFP